MTPSPDEATNESTAIEAMAPQIDLRTEIMVALTALERLPNSGLPPHVLQCRWGQHILPSAAVSARQRSVSVAGSSVRVGSEASPLTSLESAEVSMANAALFAGARDGRRLVLVPRSETFGAGRSKAPHQIETSARSTLWRRPTVRGDHQNETERVEGRIFLNKHDGLLEGL